MTRPVVLDLFCGAGGAAMGYHHAGFDVIGVDSQPQPHYPFEFHRMDWREGLERFINAADLIHASPPCQLYSCARQPSIGTLSEKQHPDLIGPVREHLQRIGKPFVIENVIGAPLRSPIILCGTMFDLPLYRHRLFESNIIIDQPRHPKHIYRVTSSVAGGNFPASMGIFIHAHTEGTPVKSARKAFGIDWTTREELRQAIPPAYTEYIGVQLWEHLSSTADSVSAEDTPSPPPTTANAGTVQ